MKPEEVEATCNKVSRLVNEREWDGAFAAAVVLYEQAAPRTPRVYFLLNLTTCLSGKQSPLGGPRSIIDAARRCPGMTDEMLGDMRRDWLIRETRQSYMSSAELDELEARIARDHINDPNRLACLKGVRAQRAFARSDYSLAEDLHSQADAEWRSIGSDADAQWAYNNLVHWLRAIVACDGRKSPTAVQLAERIRTECPPGAKNRSGEAYTLLLPFIGPTIYTWARGRR